VHASLRREAQSFLRENLSRGAGHRSDQGQIWSTIAEKSERMQVHSSTMAISDVFDSLADKLSECDDLFHPVEGQVGALFAIDGVVAGLECFSCSDTFVRFFNKLVRSYLIDAIESADKAEGIPPVGPGRAKTFLESIKKAKAQQHPAVSRGVTISFESRVAAGTALSEGQRMVHLSAFRKVRDAGRRRIGFGSTWY
jgi:hypothetical protein